MIWLKKLLILFPLLITISITGQSYFNETSVWRQWLRYNGFGWYTDELSVIRLDGDTLIGGTLFNKVLNTKSFIQYSLPGPVITAQGIIYKYMNPIREEQKLVYAFDLITLQEYLLFDFSVEVGEDLPARYCTSNKVISIDTIYLGDQPLKRFHIPKGSFEFSTLVEGIGSTLGLYWDACNTSIPPNLQQLQCYGKDGVFIQFAGGVDCSTLLLTGESIKENEIVFSPNPFQDVININFMKTLNQNTSISIANLMGEVVLHKEILSPEPFEQIDVARLPAGIYIVVLRNKTGYLAEKLVKL